MTTTDHPLQTADVLAAGLREIRKAIAIADRAEADARAGLDDSGRAAHARGCHNGAVFAFVAMAEAMGVAPHTIGAMLRSDFRVDSAEKIVKST